MISINITLILIFITVAVSAIYMENHAMKDKLMFNAYMINNRKQWYRLFSSGIIHADWFHLGFNMFSLYMFGGAVEQMYSDGYVFGDKGPILFIFLYVSSLATASLYSYEKNKNNIHYNALGASGAVSAVIFACILFSPWSTILIYFIPMPFIVFAFLYLAYKA